MTPCQEDTILSGVRMTPVEQSFCRVSKNTVFVGRQNDTVSGGHILFLAGCQDDSVRNVLSSVKMTLIWLGVKKTPCLEDTDILGMSPFRGRG